MRMTFLALAVAVPAALATGPASAAGLAGGAPAAAASSTTASYVHQVRRRVVVKRPRGRLVVVKPGRNVVVYRSWRHRPHYGRFVAGVTLGTILAVALANTTPVAPSPDVCWYWSNRAHTHGYWDYCY